MNKMLISVLLAFSALTASAQSSQPATLLDISLLSALPPVQVLGVEIDDGPLMAAVQPTAFIKFKYASCASMSLEALTQQEDGLLLVAIRVLPLQMDCMGGTISREYSLQISSDYRGGRVTVLNPIKQGLL